MVAAETILRVADQALGHEGLDNSVGGVHGLVPDGVVRVFDQPAGDFRAVHNQIKGGVFLQAYETLKGGVITELEGIKAEQAIARLSLTQSEEAYKAGLEELKEIITAGMVGQPSRYAATNRRGTMRKCSRAAGKQLAIKPLVPP